MININRRQFLKLSAATLAGSSLALMGFSPEPAMAEVAGKSAVLIGPGDRVALAEAIEATVAGGRDVRARVVAGLEIAAAHTWEASALGHLRAYRMAAEESARD